jgi:hypothetical protein
MSQFTVLVLIAISCLICLIVWNGLNYRTLKKLSLQKDKELNDAKYWELKYKYEFLIAVVALITATAGFLGYNSLHSIETAVKADFNKKVDSVKSTLQNTYIDVNSRLIAAKDSVQQVNRKVEASQIKLLKSSEVLDMLSKRQLELKQIGGKSKQALNDLSAQIDSINSKNKEKREFYLVTNVPLLGLLDPQIIKFSQLKTNTGDRLPNFKKAPFVIAAWGNKIEYRVSSTTAYEFQVQVIDYSGISVDQSAKITYYPSFIIYEVE